MKNAIELKKLLLMIGHYVYYAFVLIMLVRANILHIRNNEAQLQRIDALEQVFLVITNEQTAILIENQNIISQFVAIYSELLAEQKKRSLDSLYTQTQLREKTTEARELFIRGRYAEASALYALISTEEPGNLEISFYRYYSRFLANKSDRENYGHIKEGLLLLERNGYTRPEIREVLQYIMQEERGYIPEEMP